MKYSHTTVGLCVWFATFITMACISTPNHIWQSEAIKHGAAQYNAKTGAFEWKKPAEEESK